MGPEMSPYLEMAKPAPSTVDILNWWKDNTSFVSLAGYEVTVYSCFFHSILADIYSFTNNGKTLDTNMNYTMVMFIKLRRFRAHTPKCLNKIVKHFIKHQP